MKDLNANNPLTAAQAYYLYDMSIEDSHERKKVRQFFKSGRLLMRYLGFKTLGQVKYYTEIKERENNGKTELYYQQHTSTIHNKTFAIRKVK